MKTTVYPRIALAYSGTTMAFDISQARVHNSGDEFQEKQERHNRNKVPPLQTENHPRSSRRHKKEPCRENSNGAEADDRDEEFPARGQRRGFRRVECRQRDERQAVDKEDIVIQMRVGIAESPQGADDPFLALHDEIEEQGAGKGKRRSQDAVPLFRGGVGKIAHEGFSPMQMQG